MDQRNTQIGVPPRKPLDTVVKLALLVFFGSFGLIWGGMYLSRPDRSIPPYSIGSQIGDVVATHVPPGTTDQRIETLLRRFQRVGRQSHDFAAMKIQPTTPGDPGGRYRRIVVYIFDDDAWAEPDVLAKHLAGDASTIKDYERAMRGYYRLQDQEEEGGLGPIPTVGTTDKSRIVFKGVVTDPLPTDVEAEKDTSISPL
jgi:hypothetical protein